MTLTKGHAKSAHPSSSSRTFDGCTMLTTRANLQTWLLANYWTLTGQIPSEDEQTLQHMSLDGWLVGKVSVLPERHFWAAASPLTHSWAYPKLIRLRVQQRTSSITRGGSNGHVRCTTLLPQLAAKDATRVPSVRQGFCVLAGPNHA